MASRSTAPLTTTQVADLFNVTDQTVRNWAEDGKIPSFLTPGGQRRFRREDVEAQLGHPVEEVAS